MSEQPNRDAVAREPGTERREFLKKSLAVPPAITLMVAAVLKADEAQAVSAVVHW